MCFVTSDKQTAIPAMTSDAIIVFLRPNPLIIGTMMTQAIASTNPLKLLFRNGFPNQ